MTEKEIKFAFFMIIWLILTLLLLPGVGRTTEHIVEMQKMNFFPKEITVKVGDSIKFVNVSRNLHNVVIEKLEIRTRYIKKDESITLKMEKQGKFDYYCQPHRSMGMVGVIEVQK